MNFYTSFLVVFALLAICVPFILLFGFTGALARRSRVAPFRWFGLAYTSMVRGIPDIILFLFVPMVVSQSFLLM